MNERRIGGSLFIMAASILGMGLFLGAPRLLAQEMPIMIDDPSAKAADPNVKVPSFDVASVKENKGSDGMMRIMMKPDGFESVNLSLKSLIANAYGIKQDLIFGGPGWVDSKGFDVDAKVAGPEIESLKKLTPRQRASMMQPVLAERFHLKVHSETRVLPTYDLVVAKDGVKMKQSAPEPPPAEGEKEDASERNAGRMTVGPGEFSGQNLPMASIANQISYILHHTVVDKTGLAGKYDLTLKYTSEDSSKEDDGSTDAAGPSIFTAVQEQLGLKLVSTKGPVETLVVDHVDLPTQN